MRVPMFEMERWQSVWENQVELNLAESGVEPLTAEELVEDAEALRQLLRVRLGYPQTNGSEELRARIALLYPGARAENVLLTCGCAEANYITTWALVEPGDEVVFTQPNYMQIAGIAEGFGARVKPLWLREELGWQPDLEALAELATPKTRLIAVCNPNNPTGAVLSEPAMEAICRAAAKVGAYILADEVYRGAEFQEGAGAKHLFQAGKGAGAEHRFRTEYTSETPVPPGMASLTPSFWGRYERVISTAGLSKAYGLPGLRTGWVVGPAKLVEQLWGYHDYTTIGPTMLTERLAALALAPARRDRILARTGRILRENYPLLRDWLARHPGLLTHVPPAAGAIAWFGVRGSTRLTTGGRNTAELAEELRARKSVLICPGEQFGMPGYVRIGFGGDPEQLKQGLARIDAVLGETKR